MKITIIINTRPQFFNECDRPFAYSLLIQLKLATRQFYQSYGRPLFQPADRIRVVFG